MAVSALLEINACSEVKIESMRCSLNIKNRKTEIRFLLII